VSGLDEVSGLVEGSGLVETTELDEASWLDEATAVMGLMDMVEKALTSAEEFAAFFNEPRVKLAKEAMIEDAAD